MAIPTCLTNLWRRVLSNKERITDLEATVAALPADAISPAADNAVGSVGVGVGEYAREDHKHPAQGISANAGQLLTVGTDGLHLLATPPLGSISAGDCSGFLTPTTRNYSAGDALFFCTPDLSIITEVAAGGEIEISSGNRAVSATIAAGSTTVDLTYPVFVYDGVTTPGLYTVNTVRSISIQRVSGTEELGVNDYWDASGVLRVALRGSPSVADTHKIVVEFSLATVADQGQSGAP